MIHRNVLELYSIINVNIQIQPYRASYKNLTETIKFSLFLKFFGYFPLILSNSCIPNTPSFRCYTGQTGVGYLAKVEEIYSYFIFSI